MGSTVLLSVGLNYVYYFFFVRLNDKYCELEKARELLLEEFNREKEICEMVTNELKDVRSENSELNEEFESERKR